MIADSDVLLGRTAGGCWLVVSTVPKKNWIWIGTYTHDALTVSVGSLSSIDSAGPACQWDVYVPVSAKIPALIFPRV